MAVSQAPAGSALADDRDVVVYFEPTTATAEYGEYWIFPIKAEYAFYESVFLPDRYDLASTGVPAGFTPDVYMYGTSGNVNGQLSYPFEYEPLDVGTYSFSLSGSGPTSTGTVTGETATPATLTVTKARLGIELRAVPDVSNEELIVVTARFTGRFVEEYQSSYFPTSPQSPEGTWHIVVEGSDGTVAVERSIERSAGDDVLATSFLWTDAEPGVEYTATAEFVPSGASGGNFAVTAASEFDFTGAEEQRPTPSSTAAAQPDTGLPDAGGFGVPLWSLIVSGVLVVGLSALLTILSVRLRKRPSPTAEEVAA